MDKVEWHNKRDNSMKGIKSCHDCHLSHKNSIDRKAIYFSRWFLSSPQYFLPSNTAININLVLKSRKTKKTQWQPRKRDLWPILSWAILFFSSTTITACFWYARQSLIKTSIVWSFAHFVQHVFCITISPGIFKLLLAFDNRICWQKKVQRLSKKVCVPKKR